MPHSSRHKKIKHLPTALNVLLLIALIVSIAYWANSFLRAGNENDQTSEQAAAQDSDLSQAAILFGEEASMGASQYRLLGIVIAKNPHDSIAILGEEGKPGKPIRVGQEITPGVAVKEVGTGYAVLSDNGRSTRLLLPERAAKQSHQDVLRKSEEND